MEKTFITKKEWIEIFPEAIFYLEEDLISKTEELQLLAKIYSVQLDINREKDLDEDSKEFADTMADVFIGDDIREVEGRIRTINQYLQSTEPQVEGRINDDDIERARNYPFEDLVGTKNKFIQCPFHNDKNPSFYIKNNFGHCFSCGKTADTIAFVMETEGIGFIAAVKKLI